MRLLLTHPHLAARSCSDCRRWIYPDKPGEFAESPAERAGVKVVRLPMQLPPCSYCPKQPSDVPERSRRPETAVELSAKNWRAYHHYTECAAVGSFPDDPIVRRNAAIISRIEKDAAAVQQLQLIALGRR